MVEHTTMQQTVVDENTMENSPVSNSAKEKYKKKYNTTQNSIAECKTQQYNRIRNSTLQKTHLKHYNTEQ